MILELHNKAVFAAIDTMGAQLISLRDALGTEYLWQGNPKYWKGQAPILFPIVGRLRDGKTVIDGKEYKMGRHGFARNREFRCVMKTDDSVTLSLHSDEDTKKEYPFDFTLMIAYRLNDCTLSVEFSVINMGKEEMPYSIGGHPAFNVPVLPEERFEDYSIQFEKNEEQSCPVFDFSTELIDYINCVPVLHQEKIIPLRHDLFDKDALVFHQLNSNKVSLVSRLSGRGVEMDFSDFPYLGIWSAKGETPFVALEPWAGCGACTDEDDDFRKKRGMRNLPPNGSESLKFFVTVL